MKDIQLIKEIYNKVIRHQILIKIKITILRISFHQVINKILMKLAYFIKV
jgi:hypothetical protein